MYKVVKNWSLENSLHHSDMSSDDVDVLFYGLPDWPVNPVRPVGPGGLG